MGKLYDVGNLIVFGIKIQLYFLLRILLGGIIFGIFPAFLFLYRVIHSCFDERSISHIDLSKEIKRVEKKEMVKINIIGYVCSLLLYILTLNIQISRLFIGSRQLNIVTLVLIVSVIATSLHALPILSKYELPVRQYFLQAFLLSVISIFDTLAMVIGMFLAFALGLIIPPLGLFAGFPLLFIPYVWFSRSSIVRLEAVLYKEQNFIGESNVD